MSKFRVVIVDNERSPADTCAVLGVEVRRLIDRVTGRRSQSFIVKPEKMSLEYIRAEIMKKIALEFSYGPTETRTYRELESEIATKYGSTVDAWLEENVDLVCEVKFAGGNP